MFFFNHLYLKYYIVSNIKNYYDICYILEILYNFYILKKMIFFYYENFSNMFYILKELFFYYIFFRDY